MAVIVTVRSVHCQRPLPSLGCLSPSTLVPYACKCQVFRAPPLTMIAWECGKNLKVALSVPHADAPSKASGEIGFNCIICFLSGKKKEIGFDCVICFFYFVSCCSSRLTMSPCALTTKCSASALPSFLTGVGKIREACCLALRGRITNRKYKQKRKQGTGNQGTLGASPGGYVH